MLRFICRRLGQTIVTLLAASFVVFVLVESSPGTVARKMLGPFASTDQVQMLHESLRLGDPLIKRYFRWIGVLTGVIADPLASPELNLGFQDIRGEQYFGNFGFSTQMKQPVSDVLWGRFGNSLLLAGLAVSVIVPLALAMGMAAAINVGSVFDRTITVVGTVLASVPEFASAVILVSIFVVLLGWLPGTSPLLPSGRWPVYVQLLLPVVVLSLCDRLCGTFRAHLLYRGPGEALYTNRNPQGPAAALGRVQPCVSQRHDRAVHRNPAPGELAAQRRRGYRGRLSPIPGSADCCSRPRCSATSRSLRRRRSSPSASPY